MDFKFGRLRRRDRGAEISEIGALRTSLAVQRGSGPENRLSQVPKSPTFGAQNLFENKFASVEVRENSKFAAVELTKPELGRPQLVGSLSSLRRQRARRLEAGPFGHFGHCVHCRGQQRSPSSSSVSTASFRTCTMAFRVPRCGSETAAKAKERPPRLGATVPFWGCGSGRWLDPSPSEFGR